MMSGRWLRIAPEDELDAVADDVVLKGLDAENCVLIVRIEREKASGSTFGIEKGLCEKSIFFSSSFHSYIGKSTIQQNSKTILLRKA